MRKYLLLIILLCSVACSRAQDKSELAIRQVLAKQAAAWNSGSLEAYMQGYWQNDSLLFIGKSGPTYGYDETLHRYQKGYADTAHMGKLHFTILQVKKLSPMYRFVVGKWELARSVGDLKGYFTLLFRKVKGQWVIVADHSS